MRTQHFASILPHMGQAILAALLLSTMLLMSSCGGYAKAQQQADQNKSQLEQALRKAQTFGVANASLQQVQNQLQQLSNTKAPFTLLNDAPVTAYYDNLAIRYSQLRVQTEGIITSSTEQTRSEAQKDLQSLQSQIARTRTQGLPVNTFTQQYTQAQNLLSTAKYPKDYAAISQQARTSIQAIALMRTANDQLKIFKDAIAQMDSARIDVTALQTHYKNDLQTFNTAKTPLDFQNLSALIDAQYFVAVVDNIQALPYVTEAKIRDIEQQIKSMQQYNIDTTVYQKRLDADKAQMEKEMTISEYRTFARQVDAHIAAMRNDILKAEASSLLQTFHKEVENWGNAHLYYNRYDEQKYPLNAGYMPQGLGEDLDYQLAQATTAEDFQAVITDIQNLLFHHNMLEADYKDKTPYNKVHQSDLQLLKHYNVQKGQVIVVSLVGQAMRLYQEGKLVRSFLVTTGRVERPAIPGFSTPMGRESPTKFKSSDPKGSPYWYPDTKINYAILYRQGGFFIHDAWWRADYGPGTQFPHIDSGGDQFFSGNGSHGCVNMQEDEAAWLYGNTDWNTRIIIY